MSNEPNKPIEEEELKDKELECVVGGDVSSANVVGFCSAPKAEGGASWVLGKRDCSYDLMGTILKRRA